DVADFHSCFDISSTLDRRIEYSRLLASQRHDLFEPDGSFDRRGLPGQHLEITHHAQTSVDECVEIVCFSCARMSCLRGNRRLAARSGRVFKIARSLWVLRTVRRNDDVVQTKGEHHLT